MTGKDSEGNPDTTLGYTNGPGAVVEQNYIFHLLENTAQLQKRIAEKVRTP